MPHAEARHQHDQGRQRQPDGQAERAVQVEPGPGQDRLQALVGGGGRVADPVRLEDGRGPVAHRVVSGHHEPGQGDGGVRHPGHGCGPAVAAEQEEQHERRGGQLHRGGQAGQRAARPARRHGQAVQGDQGHQQDVDLAVVQGAAHRLEQQRRRQQPAHRPQRPRGRPGQAAQEHLQHHGEQRDAGHGEQRAGDGHRQQRQRRQHDRRDRRVGERQLHPLDHRDLPVQIPAVQPGPAAGAVGGQVDPERAEVHPVPRVRQQERRDRGQVHRHQRHPGPPRGRTLEQPRPTRRGRPRERRRGQIAGSGPYRLAAVNHLRCAHVHHSLARSEGRYGCG